MNNFWPVFLVIFAQFAFAADSKQEMVLEQTDEIAFLSGLFASDALPYKKLKNAIEGIYANDADVFLNDFSEIKNGFLNATHRDEIQALEDRLQKLRESVKIYEEKDWTWKSYTQGLRIDAALQKFAENPLIKAN